MKKFFSILVALALIFCVGSCGDKDEQNGDNMNSSVTEVESVDEDNALEGNEGNGQSDDNTSAESSDSVSSGDSDSVTFDFGMSVNDKCGMSSAIKKVDYGKISSMQNLLEDMFNTGLKNSSFSENYPIAFNEYEEFEGEDIDEQAYLVGLEDNEVEKSMIEIGAYHYSVDDKYYQYSTYLSQTFDKVSADKIKRELDKIKRAYGIKVSQKKIEKAMKTALGEAADREDAYSLTQTKNINNKDYTEKVVISVEAGCLEDGTISAYIYAERERCYK